jgi:hypothetical protein
MQENQSAAKSAKEIVMEYLQAAERRDFKSARNYVSDNISYVSPLNSFDRAEAYLKYFEHLNLPKSEIKKAFADDHDVLLLTELNFGTLPTTFVCSWFHVDNGKINAIRVVFDPRPFVQPKE